MRQEEEIQELQAVDGDLLLNGQGEEVNPHGNVIAGGHLRADDHAVIPTVNNPDLHLFIMVHKAWLLVVLEIGGAHIQPIPPRFSRERPVETILNPQMLIPFDPWTPSVSI